MTSSQPPGETVAGTYTGAEGARDWRLYVPPGVPTRGRTLHVVLHGCLQGAADIAAGSRMNEVADRERFLVLYPEQAMAANPRRCWNWFDPTHQRRGTGEPALLAGLIDSVARAHAVDPSRVHVAGISAGAAMANLLVVAYPERFASLALIAGTSWRAAADVARALVVMKEGAGNGAAPAGAMRDAMGSFARAVPVLIVHGENDAVLHPRNGAEAAAQWVALHDLVARTRGSQPLRPEGRPRVTLEHEYETVTEGWRDAEGSERVVLMRVRGLGHAWPHGSSAGTFTDPRGPDVSAAIARFGASSARTSTR